jgi:DNA-binding transcriptional ArsR family regulator
MTIDDDTASRVFIALADPTRRRILALLAESGGGTATALAAALTVSRQAVAKHLSVLDEAGLVEGTRSGREMRYGVRTAALTETSRNLADVAAVWDRRLRAIKSLAESDPNDA